MSLWDQIVDNSQELLNTAAGTALDEYAKKLAGTSPAPQGQAPAPATVGPASSVNPWLIGGAIAAVLALVAFLATRGK